MKTELNEVFTTWLNTKDYVTLSINGQVYNIDSGDVSPGTTLMQWLRSHGMRSVKPGCDTGACGACSVACVRRAPPGVTEGVYEVGNTRVEMVALNACHVPILSLHRTAIITNEGLGSSSEGLHPLQQAFVDFGATGCGFCTNGLVMTLHTMLARPSVKLSDVEDLDGNICRCTGYRPIIDAAASFLPGPPACDGKEGTRCRSDHAWDSDGIAEKAGVYVSCSGSKSSRHPANRLVYDQYQPPWPASFSKIGAGDPEALCIVSAPRPAQGKPGWDWLTPATMAQATSIMQQVAGGERELRLIYGQHHRADPVDSGQSQVCLDLAGLPQLAACTNHGGTTELGSTATIARAASFLINAKDDPASVALSQVLAGHGSRQHRDAMAIGDLLTNTSASADVIPALMALGTEVSLIAETESSTTLPAGAAISSSQAVRSLLVPRLPANAVVRCYKQGKRRQDCVGDVSACIVALPRGPVRVVVTGLSHKSPSTPFVASAAVTAGFHEALQSKNYAQVVRAMSKEMTDHYGTPEKGSGDDYRRVLALSFVKKFIVDPSSAGVTAPHHIHAQQEYEETTDVASVGKGVVHDMARQLATGEAEFTMDLRHPDEVHAFVVAAQIAGGSVISVDPSPALAMAGVLGFVDASDVPGTNMVGNIVPDEELLLTRTVRYRGQTLGLIVARTEEIARHAASLVRVEYDEEPPVLSIEDAIAKESFQGDVLETGRGDPDAGFSRSDHIIEGTVRTPAQSHIYLECNSAVAVPGEGDEMLIYSASQSPARTQEFLSAVLGVPSSKIVCRVKRIGGGFGGKESRGLCVASMVAVAAKKFRLPVKMVLDRKTDMETSGKRHPFLCNYRVGFNKDGRMVAATMDVFSNGGFSLDLSGAVLERCVLSCDNAYNIPNMKVTGKICNTNLPTNTAFRGFGSPEAHTFIETIIERISVMVNKTPEEIRELNFYHPGDETYFGQVRDVFPIRQMWDQVRATSAFDRRRREVEEYNRAHTLSKRGISMVPMCYGLSSTCSFINQGSALVHVYSNDGSVLLAHGGVEMGQGLHTKMAQVCASALGIPVELVTVGCTATDKTPNNPPTVASVGADHQGMAVLDACAKINRRLAPLKERFPEKSWPELCLAAWMEKVSLSAEGHYASPANGYDWANKRPAGDSGLIFNYYTHGVSVTEVEVDCLTGQTTPRRVDIVMDVGSSLNPLIDISQIEGGFVQGYGWVTSEEIVIADPAHAPLRPAAPGSLISNSLHKYLVPLSADIPRDIRVSLLKHTPNERPTVFRSKGIGEPPFTLSISAYMAIRDAVRAHRRSHGLDTERYWLEAPATTERVRMAITDDVSLEVLGPGAASYQCPATY